MAVVIGVKETSLFMMKFPPFNTFPPSFSPFLSSGEAVMAPEKKKKKKKKDLAVAFHLCARVCGCV